MSTQVSQSKVLVIDGDAQYRRLLRLTLEGAGHAVLEAGTAQAGLAEALHRRPDVVVVDFAPPDLPGVELIRRLRGWSHVPVLILSSVNLEGSKVAGLDAGADDYLTKPYSNGELLARLRALLRRPMPAETANTVRFGPVEVDFNLRRVTKDKQPVRLTGKEYALLRLLTSHRNQVLPHRQILGELWGPKAERQTHYLRIFMLRLRRKLENEPEDPKYLQTESGVGYRLVTDPPNGR